MVVVKLGSELPQYPFAFTDLQRSQKTFLKKESSSSSIEVQDDDFTSNMLVEAWVAGKREGRDTSSYPQKALREGWSHPLFLLPAL